MTGDRSIFLFVIWSRARVRESEIREMLGKSFDILFETDMSWPRFGFVRRLRDFYGFGGSFMWWNKARKCGRGPFRVIVVEDKSPVWVNERDTRGQELVVDANVFHAKQDARNCTHHRNCVHASMTADETEAELKALFGCGIEEFLSTLPRRKVLCGEYDFVVSLGYDCHCATMLRKCGLRSCSSPLDWLAAAPLETRLRLVETHFAGFLEKGNMRKLEKEPGAPGKGNDHYEDAATALRFFHDFRETLPFDESYAQVKAKYDRRIARLYDNVAKAKRALFVWCDLARPLSEEDCASAESRLRAAFPGKDVRLLAVSSDDDFKLVKSPLAEAMRRRTERLRLLIRCLTWPYITRAGRSAARRRLEKKWGLE